MTKIVPLQHGYFAYVDDEDHGWISERPWIVRQGYARCYSHSVINSNGNRSPVYVMMHRLILGVEPTEQIDHKDGNRLNNTRANLRVTDYYGNARNMRKATIRNGRAPSSRYKGVGRWTEKKTGIQYWRAQIVCEGKTRVSYHHSELEAAHAYDELARKLYGEYAAVNFPHDGERGALE